MATVPHSVDSGNGDFRESVARGKEVSEFGCGRPKTSRLPERVVPKRHPSYGHVDGCGGFAVSDFDQMQIALSKPSR